MNNYWATIREKIANYFFWSLENHPGKLIGLMLGFFTALTIILLGFWQTIILIGLSYLGYYLGSYWDEGQLPPWLAKFLGKITFKWKK